MSSAKQDKPLPEPMMNGSTNAYMRHCGEVQLNVDEYVDHTCSWWCCFVDLCSFCHKTAERGVYVTSPTTDGELHMKPKSPWWSTSCPDNKSHVTNTGPTWGLSAPRVPYVGPMKLAIRANNKDWQTNHILEIKFKHLPIIARKAKWLGIDAVSTVILASM